MSDANNNVRIIYGGIDVFSGIAPIPFVSREEQMLAAGERWGVLQTLTLNGQLTGILSGASGQYEDIISKQKTLLSRFGKSFQPLVVVENGETIYSGDYNIVRGINFPESRYMGILPFTISVECYPQDLFSGYYGVLEPSHEVSYEETDDGLVNITHTISAQGFNTSSTSNALDNAIGFVRGLTGLNSMCPAFFISGNILAKAMLQTSAETIDRLGAKYSVTETYVADPNGSTSGVLRYSVNINSGIQNGVTSVSIDGSLAGGREMTLGQLRGDYASIDLYSLASGSYFAVVGGTDLNTGYLSSGVQENPNDVRLTFSAAFNNDIAPPTFLDYRLSCNTDSMTEITSVSFDGTIRGRGDLKSRWERVSGYYKNDLNVWGLVSSGYSGAGGFGFTYPLNPVPRTSGVSFNSFAGTIGVNATFDNRNIPPSGFSKFDYDISFSPGIRKYSATPLLNGTVEGVQNSGYAIFDLGYWNRSVISINGSAILMTGTDMTLESGTVAIQNFLKSVISGYTNNNRRYLESFSITSGTNGVGFFPSKINISSKCLKWN